MKNKYYGPLKIKDTEVTGESVILDLSDDSQVELSAKMAEVAITKKPIDLTKLRDLRLRPIAKEMLQMWLDWDIKVSEVEYLSTLAITSLNENIEKASEKLWGGAHIDRTTSEIDKVLKDGEIK